MTTDTDAPQAGRPLAEVWFVNVGQGDCTLIVDHQTRLALLIDCPATHAGTLIDLAREQQVVLDTAIVTHWDLDHYGGLARVATAMLPRRIHYNHDTLFPDQQNPRHGIRTTLLQFLDVGRGRTALNSAAEGQAGTVGSIAWKLLAPSHRELTEAYAAQTRNVASAVADLQIGPVRILIGGDAVASTWRRLLSGDDPLEAQVLRWPHHGADLHGDRDGVTREKLLSAVRPSHVVISAGTTNRYGHPSAQVVAASSSRGVVMCTQVTSGCFGHITREERNSPQGRARAEQLRAPHCGGTIKMTITPAGFTVTPSAHELAMRIAGWTKPLCQAIPTQRVHRVAATS